MQGSKADSSEEKKIGRGEATGDKVTRAETEKLMKADFIQEAHYTVWLANVIIVKKPNGKWKMCTDYIDLNKASPNDVYPLSSIDRLVDRVSGHKLLSFLDAYLGYNQISIHPRDKLKTTFMTDDANFFYEMMPFGLQNAGVTYQRLMNKLFKDLIGRNVKVYVDDMVVKSESCDSHIQDLQKVFAALRAVGMRLNPDK